MQSTGSRRRRSGKQGIVWHNYGMIRNCEVYGSITDNNYVGGVAAVNLGLIQNCRNYAEVDSLETGETWEYEDWMSGYGAGGIAGLCATSRDVEGILPVCAVIDCYNYADVTAMSYAGGIVAYLDDRTNGQAPASSVQELVQSSDFVMPSEQAQDSELSEMTAEEGEHYSLVRCRNYGTVTVKNMRDPRTWWNTQAAGICADLNWGDIFECVNLGEVRFDESAPKYDEDGYVYTNCPMAITYNMGFAPTRKHHVINCVNLKGTIKESMRHENIMELSEEEISAWEKGNYQGDYISNNWEFDLGEAVDICGLQPLDVSGIASSKEKKNYYLCDEFALSLPEYMEIEEVYLEEEDFKSCYALHITVQNESGETEADGDEGCARDLDGREECWIVRKDADVQAAFEEAGESNTRDEWRARYFIEEIFATVAPYYYMDISPLNLPFHDTYQTQYVGSRRIFMEGSIPDSSLYEYMKEEDHMLGNMIAMSLEGNGKDEFEAKWLFVFTMKETNIRPSRAFIYRIESGFYPFSGNEEIHVVEAGDSLWKLAKQYTLNPLNWEMLADINGLDDSGHIVAGNSLRMPSLEDWKEKETKLGAELFRSP